jgi:uncharacterized membrane protein YjjB (DUF3815 family)
MTEGQSKLTQYLGYALIGIIAIVVFRLLMPAGSHGSIWLAAIVVGVLFAGWLNLSVRKKK